MYRNLHGSGDMDAEVDDICTTWRGDVYRIIVNSTQKNSKKWRVTNVRFWFEDLLYMWQWGFIQNQVQNFIDVQYKLSIDPSLPQIPPHSTRFSVATLLPQG